jgi:hypothetical protein
MRKFTYLVGYTRRARDRVEIRSREKWAKKQRYGFIDPPPYLIRGVLRISTLSLALSREWKYARERSGRRNRDTPGREDPKHETLDHETLDSPGERTRNMNPEPLDTGEGTGSARARASRKPSRSDLTTDIYIYMTTDIYIYDN